MTSLEVDPDRLAEAAGRFDEQGARVTALLQRFSSLMDPVVSGSDPATAPLTVFKQSVEQQKQGLEALQQFCYGTAERIRAAAADYRTTGIDLEAEARQLRDLMAVMMPASPGTPGEPPAGNGDS